MEKYIYIYIYCAIEIDQRLIKQAKRCWRRHNVSLYCEDRFDSPLNHLGAILPHWFFARFRAFIVKVLVSISFSKVFKVSTRSNRDLSLLLCSNPLVPVSNGETISIRKRRLIFSSV